MNDSPAELLAALTELRTQLEEANKRIAALEKVVKTTTAEDGTTRTHIECHTLALRGGADGKQLGIYMGVHKAKPFLHLFAQGTEKEVRLFKLETDPEGECRLILTGRDEKTKAIIKVQQGAGLFAAYTPTDTAGVLVKGHLGGGSVAVLHPQTGIPRGILIHNTTPEEQAAGGSGMTELSFQEIPTQSTARLRSENGNHSLLLATEDRKTLTMLGVTGDMANITAQTRTDEGGVTATLVAAPEMGRIFLCPGEQGAHHAEAALELIQRQPTLVLKYPNGEAAIEAGITGDTTTLTVRTEDARKVFEILAKEDGIHSCTFNHQDGTPFHQLLCNDQSSSLHFTALGDAELGLLTMTQPGTISTTLHRGPRPLVIIGFAENGGTVTTASSEPAGGGAVLSGGPYGGSLVLSNADGQVQASLDASDYGGRFNINNDLGFPRISMGVHEESAGIHLNHTGLPGVSAMATPMGGIIMVRDAEGNPRASLPDKDEEE